MVLESQLPHAIVDLLFQIDLCRCEAALCQPCHAVTHASNIFKTHPVETLAPRLLAHPLFRRASSIEGHGLVYFRRPCQLVPLWNERRIPFNVVKTQPIETLAPRLLLFPLLCCAQAQSRVESKSMSLKYEELLYISAKYL